MSFDFQRRGHSFSPCSLDDNSRKYQEYILDDYQFAWDINNESVIRSCEQKLIKLDKKTLVGYLQQFVDIQSWRFHLFIKQTETKYTSCICVLHLLHVFCITGQKEKIKVVQVELNEMLQYCTEEERFDIFERYLSQQLKVKSNLTDKDFLMGQIDPHHEFLLKLCNWDILCNKKTEEDCKEFLQQNFDYLISNIEGEVRSIPSKFLKNDKTKLISCTMLLCLLNWKICKTQTPVTIQNREAPASSSVVLVADTSVSYSCTAHKVRNILQKILSTLSKDDIFTVFNNYINKMYAMKSDLTEDDFCTGKIESFREFQLKLCYCEKLCNKNDDEAYKEFLRRNADMLVSQIEGLALGNLAKTKLFACKTLLCLLKWNICDKKTNPVPMNIQNCEIKDTYLFTLEDEKSTKYLTTVDKVRSVLQILLSTLSEDEIFTAFNENIDQIHATQSDITEDDFCIYKIGPFREFQLKLCYSEKLCHKKDEETCKNFLRKNANFLVPQIIDVVNSNETKTMLISCKVLICLLKWDICNQKTAYTSLQNILSQELPKEAVYKKFMTENALVFLSMVGTLMTSHVIPVPVLIELCDVLLCIPYNQCHFQDVTGAVNKLIRYYVTQVGLNKDILEWILLLGYRYLKHLNDDQKQDFAKNTKNDFMAFCNLLKELFSVSMPGRKLLNLGFNAFMMNHDCENPCWDQDEIEYYLQKRVKDQDVIKLKELWIDKLKSIMKEIQLSKNKRNIVEVSVYKLYKYLIPFHRLYFIDQWSANSKKNAKSIEALLTFTNIADEMVKKCNLSAMFVLLMMLLIVGTSDGHHKSAKLKKYLTLKYEYATASLYLLWCSGDIEVHPGPSLNKKTLAHDSSIERRWIQNISPKIIIRLPDHEQSKYKPTKKRRNDRENKEYFKTLLEICQEEKVCVPKMYLAEINAWETMEYNLLHRLFVYRCEFETIISSLQDFFICGGITKDLTDINVSLDTELKTNEITTILGKDHRPTDKSQLIVYITRHIAGIAIKCAHGEDPDAKSDGLWDLPLKNWPKDVILFDPNNRGKYREEKNGKKLIPDQELVDVLLRLPQVTIPQKYKDIIEAFKAMRKSKTKQQKEQLCSTFKRSTSLAKINYALKNLCKNGILTKEIYEILTKWWKTGTVESRDDQTQSLENMDDAKKIERPHILIYIHTKSITFTVEPTSPNSSQVSYNFPVKYELVPLKTMKLLPTPEENPGDNQTDTIIPQATTNILNSIITFDPNSQEMFESDIKLQCQTSTQDTASSSMTHLNQTTSSSFQFSQWNQNIAIYGQPGPILCTHNQLTTNSDDLGHLHLSATKYSKNLAFQNLVSPTSDMGSSNSISSVNSESGNEERDQNNTLNEGQDLSTDSYYSSNSSNNCVSKTSLKKRKCIEEDRIEMKKIKIPSLKQDKKQSDPTNHRKDDSSMDNSTIFNTNMKLLQDCLQIDLDSFVFDDQTFDVKLNALDNEDKNRQICDKDGNLMNGETQMSNENTNISAYNTSVSTILEKFVQDMIN